MTEEKYFLKPNIVIEPLFCQWYAWFHLISPATAAMNIVGRHLRIMNSYIQSPQIHAAAVLNPKMRGGPFMDFQESKVEEIKALKNETLDLQRKYIELAESIQILDRLLKERAKGHSLEPLYELIPNPLKGFVELVYDLNNHPSFRFFEYLLYKSEYYNENLQSIALWQTENDERPFCLSTPRIPGKDILHLTIPFRHEAIDLLCQMKREAGSIDTIAQVLNIGGQERNLFNSFFTLDGGSPYKRYTGKNVRMRYFGHACILIETQHTAILVDPLISYYGYQSSIEHFSDVDLPDIIDYVLITHNHQDHILLETLLPLRHKIKKILIPRTTNGSLQDPNLKLAFNAIGFNNVVEIDDMEEIIFNDCRITGIPFTGEHSDLNIKAKTCYHISIDRFKFMFMADSRVVDPVLYENIQKIIGDVDVLFLGMECDGAPLTWLYGPLLTEDLSREKDQSRRLAGSDFQRGMHLVNIFRPKELYVYAMGQEPWLEFISSIKYTEESNPIVQSDKLIEESRKKGIVAERLYGEKELLY